MLIDDPLSIVEGLEALVDLIAAEGIDAASTLVSAYVEGVRYNQERDNPYDRDDQPIVYETFRTHWYQGYAAGFLSKMLLGGAAWKSAKATIQGTGTYASVAARLASTRVLQILQRADGARNAMKARATARLLLQVDDAPGTLLRNADTAGEAYRMWRLGRQFDGDVDALPSGQQDRLQKLLRRHGDDGVETLNRMDADTRDQLLRATSRTSDPADVVVGATRRTDLDANEFVSDVGPDGLELLSKLDEPTGTRTLVRYADGDLDASHVSRLNRMLDAGDVDSADIQRIYGILESKDVNPVLDPRISADELLDIGSRNSDVSDTAMVVRDGNGNVRWTEFEGGIETIMRKHGDDILGHYGRADSVPGIRTIESQADVNRLLYDAIKRSDSDIVETSPNPGGGTRYHLTVSSDPGTKPLRVVVGDNGFVFNAFPARP